LQRICRIERRFLAPQRVDQGGLRDRPRDVNRKPDQESSQPWSSQVDATFGARFTGADVEWSEEIDPHPFTIAAARTTMAAPSDGALSVVDKIVSSH